MTLDNPPEECWEWAKDNARPVAIPATRTPTANSVLTTSSPMRPYGTSGVGGRRFPVPHRPTDQHNRAESPRPGREAKPGPQMAWQPCANGDYRPAVALSYTIQTKRPCSEFP